MDLRRSEGVALSNRDIEEDVVLQIGVEGHVEAVF